MTVKTSVSFTDRHHEFANKKAKEGVYNSVSSVVAAGIELVMQDEAEREVALKVMGDTIKRRMQTPRKEWVEMNEEDALFIKAKARLQSSQSK
ncbi:MAG: type II toxin-antitoxin system ParD family antitoxin [Devosiaceae bacterium]|nr:type II toxin-antitoxin system ParD family antitoxin [Devosiaceae bacterium]